MAPTRPRGRGEQRGTTLIEMLLVISVTGILIIPLVGWMILGMKVNTRVQETSAETSSRNLLSAYLARDVVASTSATAGGADCSGGEGAGGEVLLQLAVHEGTRRVVYAAVPESGERFDVWRRSCELDGTSTESTRVAEAVVMPAAGWGSAAQCLPALGCRRIEIALTTASGHAVEAGVVRRIGVDG